MPRKQIHYIYKTTCLITNRFYVGMHSTSNLKDGYMGSGRRLRYSLKKHGIKNHKKEILEFLPDRNSLKKREAEIINEQLLNDPNCMNLQPGGGGGFINADHAKKAQTAGTEAFVQKIKNDELFREKIIKQRADTFKEYHKLGILHQFDWNGRSHRTETKQKIGRSNSDKQSGSKNSQYGTKWIYNIELNVNKKLKNGESIPIGWKFGRIKQTS